MIPRSAARMASNGYGGAPKVCYSLPNGWRDKGLWKRWRQFLGHKLIYIVVVAVVNAVDVL